MNKMTTIFSLLLITSTGYAQVSLSKALRQAEVQNQNKDQAQLVKAISCVKFGNDCPVTLEGKRETYNIVASEVTKAIQSGIWEATQQDLELLDLATAYYLSK